MTLITATRLANISHFEYMPAPDEFLSPVFCQSVPVAVRPKMIGFTLIELLVVMLITAVLASLAAPALGAFKARVACEQDRADDQAIYVINGEDTGPVDGILSVVISVLRHRHINLRGRQAHYSSSHPR